MTSPSKKPSASTQTPPTCAATQARRRGRVFRVECHLGGGARAATAGTGGSDPRPTGEQASDRDRQNGYTYSAFWEVWGLVCFGLEGGLVEVELFFSLRCFYFWSGFVCVFCGNIFVMELIVDFVALIVWISGSVDVWWCMTCWVFAILRVVLSAKAKSIALEFRRSAMSWTWKPSLWEKAGTAETSTWKTTPDGATGGLHPVELRLRLRISRCNLLFQCRRGLWNGGECVEW